MKGCLTSKFVLNPNLSALAIASSVVPDLWHSFLNSEKLLTLLNLLLI